MVVSGALKPCRAHSDSEAQVDLTIMPGQVHGRWHAALRDLDHVLELDADGDARITRVEWEARRSEAMRYFQDHLRLSNDGQSISLAVGEWSLAQTWQGLAATLEFSARHPEKGGALGFEYHAFFEGDPWHRSRVVLTLPDGRTVTELLSPERTRLMIPAVRDPAPRPDHSRIWAICATAGVMISLVQMRARHTARMRQGRVDRGPA